MPDGRSIGAVIGAGPVVTPIGDVLNRADQALYSAKNGDRNRAETVTG